MALLFDLREMMYKGKPVWKRVIENIVDLSKQVDALSDEGTSSGASITGINKKIEDLEKRIEALEPTDTE